MFNARTTAFRAFPHFPIKNCFRFRGSDFGFALFKALDSQEGLREAPVFTGLRLYYVERLSAERLAKRCRCSKATIINRLRIIHRKTGTNPNQLRAYSSQFESIEKSLSDPRAKRIYRKGAAYGDEESEESQE